jgi:uncharacterized protein (UPF0335 family)
METEIAELRQAIKEVYAEDKENSVGLKSNVAAHLLTDKKRKKIEEKAESHEYVAARLGFLADTGLGQAALQRVRPTPIHAVS